MAEQKKKLEAVTEVLGKRGLATRPVAPEDLATPPTVAIRRDPVQSKRSDKANPDTNRKMDLGVRNKPPEPFISSISSKIELGSPEEQQEVPLVGGASPQINSIIKMQTCSLCHELFCGDAPSKADSDGTKTLCDLCTESLAAAESSSIEETLTLYRCGVCFMNFFERDVLARHMDEQHAVPSVVTRTSTHTTVTSLSQSVTMLTDVAVLCPPVNLLLQNIVLQPRPTIQALPLTLTNQNILLNSAAMFALQPSVLTSAVITPKNFLSGPSMSLSIPEGSTDPGKVLLPDPVSQVTKPKLDSVNKARDNNRTPLDGNPVEKTKIRKSNNQSAK